VIHKDEEGLRDDALDDFPSGLEARTNKDLAAEVAEVDS